MTVNEKCSALEFCSDQTGLNCQEGVCKCANNSYWKDTKCSNCLFYKYISTVNCLHWLLFKDLGHTINQKCANSEECDKTKKLDCKEGACICKETNLYWNEKATTCRKKQSILTNNYFQFYNI